MDNLNYPDRRKVDVPTQYRRRASDWDPTYEWLLTQVRAGLATAADSAGELSALNKDLKDNDNKLNEVIRGLDVLRVAHSKDIEVLQKNQKELKDNLKSFQEKLSIFKVVPFLITVTLFTIGMVELVIKVVTYLQALNIKP